MKAICWPKNLTIFLERLTNWAVIRRMSEKEWHKAKVRKKLLYSEYD